MGTNAQRSSSQGTLDSLDKQQRNPSYQNFKPQDQFTRSLGETPWSSSQGFGSQFNSMPKWLQEHLSSQEGSYKGLNYDVSDIYNAYAPKINNLYNTYSQEQISKPFWLQEGRDFKDSYLNPNTTGQFDWKAPSGMDPTGQKALYNPWSGQQLTNAYMPGTADQYAQTKQHYPGTTAYYNQRAPYQAPPPNYLGGE